MDAKITYKRVDILALIVADLEKRGLAQSKTYKPMKAYDDDDKEFWLYSIVIDSTGRIECDSKEI